MKVLEKAPVWSIKVRCTGRGNGDGGCKSLLLVEESDIYATASTAYTGEVEFFYTITCPVCGKETDIPQKYLPYSITTKKLKEYEEAYEKRHGRRR